MDITDLESITDIEQTISKLEIPGIDNKTSNIMCFNDSDGKEKCLITSGKNEIRCNDSSCFVYYKTLNQHILGHGNRLKKLGLDALLVPKGLSTEVTVLGNFPLKKLRTVKKIVGETPVTHSEILPIIHEGLPDPPKKCHLNPFTSDCLPYLQSDDWVLIPAIGLKKRIDLAKNPKNAFKSEIAFDKNSWKKLFKK